MFLLYITASMFSPVVLPSLTPLINTGSSGSFLGVDQGLLPGALRAMKTSSMSVSTGMPDTILNRPYVTSVYAPAIEAGGKALAFGDFSYYWIADRQGRSLKRLNELFAMNGQIGFLASERVDGKLILPEAVKVLTMKA